MQAERRGRRAAAQAPRPPGPSGKRRRGGRGRRRQRVSPPPAGPAGRRPRGRAATPARRLPVRSSRAGASATEAGPATGLSLRAPPSAPVVVALRRPGGLRRAVPQLRAAVDPGLRRRLPLRSGRAGPAGRPAGNAVQAGEPVGVMPDWDPRAPGTRPALYVELRRDGQPVDPAPWLRATDDGL